MFKLLKYLLSLALITFVFQYLSTQKSFPSLPGLREYTEKIFKQTPFSSSLENSSKNSIDNIVKNLQNNEIANIKDIWAQLGVKSELFKKGVPFLAESFNLQPNLKEEPLKVFIITNKEDLDWQFLLFNIKNRAWNFYGHIDLKNQEASEPISRTVTIEDQSWFVITSLAETSSLPGMYQEIWYDLGAPKLKTAFRYYVYQDLFGPEFSKRYSAQVLQSGRITGTYFIELRFLVSYHHDLIAQTGLEPIFSVSREARYLWDNSSRQFRNQANDNNDLFNYGAEQILIHNYLQFESLAINGSPSQRHLVKLFLNECANIPEKKRILDIIYN